MATHSFSSQVVEVHRPEVRDASHVLPVDVSDLLSVVHPVELRHRRWCGTLAAAEVLWPSRG